MATIILDTNNFGTLLKQHIDENHLIPIIVISFIKNQSKDLVDIFSVGSYPSQELITIMKQVTNRLIEERREYLTKEETE